MKCLTFFLLFLLSLATCNDNEKQPAEKSLGVCGETKARLGGIKLTGLHLALHLFMALKPRFDHCHLLLEHQTGLQRYDRGFLTSIKNILANRLNLKFKPGALTPIIKVIDLSIQFI